VVGQRDSGWPPLASPTPAPDLLPTLSLNQPGGGVQAVATMLGHGHNGDTGLSDRFRSSLPAACSTCSAARPEQKGLRGGALLPIRALVSAAYRSPWIEESTQLPSGTRPARQGPCCRRSSRLLPPLPRLGAGVHAAVRARGPLSRIGRGASNRAMASCSSAVLSSRKPSCQ